jgi:hypothetical protein
VKFRNIEESVLRAVQCERDDVEDRELSDTESDGDDSDSEADMNDTQPPPRALTFKIDPHIDITSPALRDMVATEQCIVQLALAFFPCVNTAETSNAEPDWEW